MASRVWHGGLATVAAVSLVLVLGLAVWGDGATAATRVARTASYFTNLSVLLVALTAGSLALRPERDGRWWRALRLDALICITITGLVYAVVLRPIDDPQGWYRATNVVQHYLVPLAALAGWAAFGPRSRIDRRTVGRALVLPLLWLAATLARGAATGWYPYPFLDAAGLGYPRVVANCAAVVALFLTLAAGLAAVDRRAVRRPAAQDVVSEAP